MPSDKKNGLVELDPEPQTQPAGPRPKAAIQADLDAAKAEFHRLMPQVEADRKRVKKQDARIAVAQHNWKQQRPGEPFDPDEFQPPMRPLKHDAALHDEFYTLHYRIDFLEREMSEGYGPDARLAALIEEFRRGRK